MVKRQPGFVLIGPARGEAAGGDRDLPGPGAFPALPAGRLKSARGLAHGTSPGGFPREQLGGRADDPPSRRSLADRTPVSLVMKTRVVCVRPEVRIDALLTFLTGRGLRAVPVVDGGGRPVGMVSLGDLARARGGGGGGRVADVMMSLAFSLPETASLSRAAALMAYEGIHRLPVVGPDGQLAGLVSALDIMRWMARQDGYRVPERRRES